MINPMRSMDPCAVIASKDGAIILATVKVGSLLAIVGTGWPDTIRMGLVGRRLHDVIGDSRFAKDTHWGRLTIVSTDMREVSFVPPDPFDGEIKAQTHDDVVILEVDGVVEPVSMKAWIAASPIP